MVKILIILTFIMSAGASAQTPSNTDSDCGDLLNWIYRDFTLNNVDLSYKRLMQKLIISIHYANEYNKHSNKRRLNDALDEIKGIDQDFEAFLETPPRYRYSAFWRMISGDNSTVPLSPSNLGNAIERWRTLQRENPKYFEGMDSKYLLDEWDNQTVEILSQLSSYEFEDHAFREELTNIANGLNQANTDILNGSRFDTDEIENDIMTTNDEIIAALIEAYSDNTNEFAAICPQDQMKLYIQTNNLFCPIAPKESGVEGVQDQLKELQLLISNSNLLQSTPPTIPEPEVSNDPPLEITQLNYSTSPLRAATYCRRPLEMATMITLHHTGTDANPYQINRHHINQFRGTTYPWYMIGYNYVIESDFQHGTSDSPQIFQGRPPDMKGAHAGSEAYTERLTSEQKEFYNQFQILCGNDQVGFTPSPLSDHIDYNPRTRRGSGGISGNLASIGIAVSGDLSRVRIRTVGGVATPVNIDRSRAILPTGLEVQKVADLSCQLQKQNPNIKTIVPHSYWKSTDCPAALVLYFQEIKRLAAAKGCHFDIKLRKGTR